MSIEIESSCFENEVYENHSVSCIGGRDENQDCCYSVMTPRGFLVIVSDGMGGMNGGATASKLAVETISEYVNMPSMEDDIEDSNKLVLTKAICKANSRIMDEAENDSSLSGMGCTVTAVLINDDLATLAYVGDSRIYQLRSGKKVFRTFDHSMVFEMVRKKIITEEQARLSAQSNIILRALGQKEDVQVDTFEQPYDKGDIFLLCTDGIWGTMSEKELIRRVCEKKRPKVVMESLARNIHQNAMAKGGGHDNLTAAMIVTSKNSKIRNKMEKKLKMALIIASTLLLVSIVACAILVVKCTKYERSPIVEQLDSLNVNVLNGNEAMMMDSDSTFVTLKFKKHIINK